MSFSIKMQSFECPYGESVRIVVKDMMISMPFFRQDDDEIRDATGDYDLVLDPDGESLSFTNRRAGTEKFFFRYFSTSWLARRLGKA